MQAQTPGRRGARKQEAASLAKSKVRLAKSQRQRSTRLGKRAHSPSDPLGPHFPMATLATTAKPLAA